MANLLFMQMEDFSAEELNPYNIPTVYLPAWLQSHFTSDSKVNEMAKNIIDYSQQFIGKPYRRGSKGPNAFDCSGFTSYVFKQFGYQLNGGCVTQIKEGIKVKKEELQTGDLIFFKGRNAKSSRVGHVGIVVSNDGDGNITFIHASSRGVNIEDLSTSNYYKPRYVTGLRVLDRNNSKI